jgi:hypothetical protein
MLEGRSCLLLSLAWFVEVAFGDYPEGTDGRERAALGAVNLVNVVVLPY